MEDSKVREVKNAKKNIRAYISRKVVFRRLPIECSVEEFEEAFLRRFGSPATTIRFETGKKK